MPDKPKARDWQRVDTNIWKRGDRYIVRYRDHRGKWRNKSCRTLTEARSFRAKAADGNTRPTTAETFPTYVDHWLKTYAGRTAGGVSDRTRESYADSLKRFAKPFFGSVKLAAIDAPMLREYIADLAGRGQAPASVRRHFAPVRALLATAHEDGSIARNPAHGMRVVVRDTRTVKPKRLTPKQTTALLAEIPVEHADLAYFLASTGARISEALAFRYGGIGLDPDGRPTLQFAQSKTEAGKRPIPLTPETARMLTRRRAEADAGADDLVFPSETGTEIDPRNWRRRVFKPAAERAGVPWATPHKLRHGVASLMAEQGFDGHDIARILRHADGGALAQRTYIHPKARAVDFLDDVLGAD